MNTDDYMTAPEAIEALGCSPRALTRAAERAERAGYVVRERVLGRSVYLRAALPRLREHYYPYGSENHKRMLLVWGEAGGKARWAGKKTVKKRRKTVDQ